MSLGLMAAVCVVVFAGCGGHKTDPSMTEQRQKVIREWVGDFKARLVDLADEYPELKGVASADFAESGLVFDNDVAQPPVRIAMKVQDTRKARATSAAAADALEGIGITCALDLECENRPMLEVHIPLLYDRFKAFLGKGR